MRSTIYVGIGGFGTSTVRKIKESINREITDKTKRKSFAYLALDSKSREEGGGGFNQREYLQFTVDRAPHILAKQPDFSKHLSWYNEVVQRWIAPRSITNGCNAKRALGRFVFHFHTSVFAQYFEAAYNQVLSADAGSDQKPKVVLISSLAGGTGSGMLLDVIFVIANIMNTKRGDRFAFQAYLATADSLQLTQRNSIDSNTYATMKELFHFSQADSALNKRILYFSDPAPVDVGSYLMPDNIVLVTNQNLKGRIIFEPKDNMQETSDLISSYILFEVLTPQDTSGGAPDLFGTENIDHEPIGMSGMPRIVESIGAIRFGLPADVIEKIFTYLLLEAVLNAEIHCEIENVSGDDWINKNNIGEAGSDQLQERIRTDKQGLKIRKTIDFKREVADSGRSVLLNACKSKIKGLDSSLSDQNENILRSNREQLVLDYTEILNNELNSIQRSKSLCHALNFMQSVHSAIKIHKKALSNELDIARNNIDVSINKLNESLEALAEVTASMMPFGRGEKIRNCLSSIEGELNAKQNLQIASWSQEQGIVFYDALISLCESKIDDIQLTLKILCAREEVLKQKITELTIDLNKMADFNASGQYRKSLIDYSQAKELYHEKYDSDSITAILKRTRDSFCDNLYIDIDSLDNDWIEKASIMFSKEVQEKIVSLSLQRIIERYFEGNALGTLFKNIFAYGSPLFPMLESEREKDSPTHRLIAVHDDNDKYIKELVRHYGDAESQILSAKSLDRHEVTIYTVMKGLTMHSLTTINEYKKAYDFRTLKREKLIKGGGTAPPIHGWPDAENWNEVMPRNEGEEDGIRWFILGRVFSDLYPTVVGENGKPDEKKNKSFIYKRGNYYYLQANSKEDRLGNSLESAIDKFQNNRDWIEYIKTEIDKKISTEGSLEILNNFQADPEDESKFLWEPLNSEIQAAKKGRDFARERLLIALKQELNKYLASLKGRRL